MVSPKIVVIVHEKKMENFKKKIREITEKIVGM